MAPVFSQLQHSQKQSALCRLPAEIRLAVLRELLRFSSCSSQNMQVLFLNKSHRQQRQAISKTLSNIRSGLRLGQCCQLFHMEALHVFYSENVLRLVFYDNHVVTSLPGILGASSTPRAYVIPLPNTKEYAGMEWKHLLKQRYYTKRHNKSVHQSLKRFQVIKVVLCGKDPRLSYDPTMENIVDSTACELARFVRRFRDILQDKHLDLEVAAYQSISRKYHARMLAGCKIFHCASIKFNGQLAPSSITQYTTGSEQVRDTYREWYSIYNNFVFGLPGGYHFIGQNFRKLREIEQAAWRYDPELFSEKLSIVLREARKWTDLKIKQKLHEAVAYKNQANGLRQLLIKDYGQSLGDHFNSELLEFDIAPEIDLSGHPFTHRWGE